MMRRKYRVTCALLLAIGLSFVPRTVLAEDKEPTSQPATYELSPSGLTGTNVTGGQLVINNAQPDNKQVVFTFQPQMVKAAYLGLETGRADATLQAQLKMPEGVGLTVQHVYDKSPAQQAGVQNHDVLYKLNDQLLINPEQYAVLVRTFKPGDTVELTVIREAQPVKLKAKLIEQEVAALSAVLNDLRIQTPNAANLSPLNAQTFQNTFYPQSNGVYTGTVNIVPQGSDPWQPPTAPPPTPSPSPSK
jgi:hypothetical protein